VAEREYVDEAALQRAIVKAILKLRPNAWVFHPVGGPYQQPGIPDLLICIDGLLIGMEIKHKKYNESLEHARNRATPEQRRQIRLINASGGMAGVVTSVKEALNLVNRAFVKHDALYKEKEH
jgi:hypothetical protein